MATQEDLARRWAVLQGEQLANNVMITQLMAVVVVQTENSSGLLRMLAGLVDKTLSNSIISADGPEAETLKTLTVESARRTVDETMSAIAALLRQQKKD